MQVGEERAEDPLRVLRPPHQLLLPRESEFTSG